LEGCTPILSPHPAPGITYFPHTVTHAFTGAAAAAAILALQSLETGEVAFAMLLPQQPVLLGNSMFCQGSEPALNFRMLVVDRVIFCCLQGAIP